MFRFDIYMEQWAEKYKPIQHSEGRRRFFRVNDEMAIDEMLQNYISVDPPGDPCCGIVTHLEGTIDITKRFDYPYVKLLFMKWGVDMADYRIQADAKADCFLHAKKFLLYLEQDVKKAKTRRDPKNPDPLAYVDLTNVRYETLGPMASDGWFMVLVTIQVSEFDKICFSESDYLE
ncbi:MAG: hypothetical protein LUE98_04555 [Tannerellaceae bacterium]|nr:hypothetical protein [Tannerellaceae bacterium]